MTGEVHTDHQRSLLQAAVARAGLTLEQLWLRYFALGGTAGVVDIEAYLEQLLPLPPLDRDMLAIVVNERLDELSWPHRVPYANSVREPLPAAGPLTALVDMLESARSKPAELLASIARNAARALDVSTQIYLVDEEQRELRPLEPRVAGSDSPGQPLAVDATIAGRAFREQQTIASEAEAGNAMWVPLLDDAERVGVLRVAVGTPAELNDPALRQQAEWFSHLLAHLVTLAGQYGDTLNITRRRRPRTAAAELIWALVPPRTAAVAGFTLAAAIEPSHRAGGDAYDYALSDTTAELAIFDAMGHDLSAGLVTATALAGLRAARRDARDLYEQASAIDDLISRHFGRGTFATGVLISFDLRRGELRYLSAGHLNPLIIREGKVVRRLGAGRRLPFGLGGSASIGQEMLQPGDWLVLHTDGLTEARAADATFFGEQRLKDFLEREAAAQRPAPETVRRLIHAVLDHQGGHLTDDASVIVAQWMPT